MKMTTTPSVSYQPDFVDFVEGKFKEIIKGIVAVIGNGPELQTESAVQVTAGDDHHAVSKHPKAHSKARRHH